MEFASETAPVIIWRDDGDDLERSPNFRKLEVQSICDITPHMRRITFHCDDAVRYAIIGCLTCHLMAQKPDSDVPQWPRIGLNGLILWANPELRPDMRKYTLRSVEVDTGLIDIDFILHDNAGPGSNYAAQTRVGDELSVIGPGGGGLIDAQWYLFAGDETALRVLARMLEYLPASASGYTFIEVTDESEVQSIYFKAAIKANWLCRGRAAT